MILIKNIDNKINMIDKQKATKINNRIKRKKKT